MKTDELIDLLAQGSPAVDTAAPARRFAGATIAGLSASVALTLALLGLRPNLAQEAAVPMFWVREVFCAAMGSMGLWAVARLARPGRRLGAVRAAIGLALAALWLLASWDLMQADASTRMSLMMGQTARACPWLIAMVSAPLLAAFLWATKAMAPTRLRLAGAACGVAAGGLGALAYTLHCPELAAPFLALWYVLGIALTGLAGLLLGPRILRW
jgi:hypothetical protein